MARWGAVQPKDHRLLSVLNGKFAKVDIDVFEQIGHLNWCLNNYGYVTSWNEGRNVQLHRWITSCPSGLEVDHINHDPLDNRRENLRVCNDSEQQGNRLKLPSHKTSQYRGVSICRRSKQFIAFGKTGKNKTKNLGRFTDEIEAAKAYDTWAAEYFGEFARLNFPSATKSKDS